MFFFYLSIQVSKSVSFIKIFTKIVAEKQKTFYENIFKIKKKAKHKKYVFF